MVFPSLLQKLSPRLSDKSHDFSTLTPHKQQGRGSKSPNVKYRVLFAPTHSCLPHESFRVARMVEVH